MGSVASNPMASAMASRIVQALANRGGGGGAPGGPPGGGSPTMPGMEGQPDMTAKVGSELTDIGSADPAAIRGLLLQIKQQLVALIPHTAFRIPGITKHISKALDNINAATDEANKALQTTQAVSATPIGMSAVQNAAGTTGPGMGM